MATMDGKHMTKDQVRSTEEALDLALEALEVAQDNLRPHGDNCFLHDDGEYNRCFCGKDSLVSYLQDAVEKLDTAIKQARALDKMAAVVEPHKNARELGLDYEPAEVLGHNGWGFPIKAAAPMQEDWGPGPHEYHSLTAAPVQEPVAYRSRMRNRDGQVITGWVVHTDTSENPDPRIEIEPLYTTPPAAQRQSARSAWVGLTDEEVRETISSVHIEPLFSYRHVARAIEAKLKAKNSL